MCCDVTELDALFERVSDIKQREDKIRRKQQEDKARQEELKKGEY